MENESLSSLNNSDRIDSQIQSKSEFLNPSQAAAYLSQSISAVYRLSSKRVVPHYKPGGKRIYFRRSDLDQYILQGRVDSIEEIEHKASLLIRPRRFR